MRLPSDFGASIADSMATAYGCAGMSSGRTSMAKTDYKSVDAYIAAQPEQVQDVLQRVRRIIRAAIPGASEVISYQMPAYNVNGRAVVAFAGWKHHYSLYPIGDRLAAFKKELAPYELSKGTVRFPLSQPIPVRLITRLAKYRAKHVAELEKKKAAASKKR